MQKNFIRGYINATQLCKAGGKLFSHWHTLETTKKLINVLASNIGITETNLIEKNIGYNNSSSSSSNSIWIHPDLAIQLAQWSPKKILNI